MERGRWAAISLTLAVVAAVVGSTIVYNILVDDTEVETDFGDGNLLADVEMSFLGPDGDPIRSNTEERSFLTDTNQQVDAFAVQFNRIEVNGAGVDPNTLKVTMFVKFDRSDGDSPIIDSYAWYADKGHLTITGDTSGFKAVSKNEWSYSQNLVSIADQLGIDYKQDNLRWTFRAKVKAEADGLVGEFNLPISLRTSWEDPVGEVFGDSYLLVDADVGSDPSVQDWGDLKGSAESLVPIDSVGMSILFVFLVAAIYFWNSKLRKVSR